MQESSAIVTLFASAALLLAACGGGADADTTVAPPTTAPVTTTTVVYVPPAQEPGVDLTEAICETWTETQLYEQVEVLMTSGWDTEFGALQSIHLAIFEGCPQWSDVLASRTVDYYPHYVPDLIAWFESR